MTNTDTHFNLSTGSSENEDPIILTDRKTLCDDCIHIEVCCSEGHFDPAMTYCADKLRNGYFSGKLLLSEVTPYLTGKYFTVIKESGEPNNPDTYTNPANYRVICIDYCEEERKMLVGVTKI